MTCQYVHKVSSQLPIQNIKLAVGCRLPVTGCRFSCRLSVADSKHNVSSGLPIKLPVADSVADSKQTI